MKVLVIYESTRGRTKAMAEAICEGVKSKDKKCSLVDAKNYSGLSDACAIAIGSSTRMKRPLPKTRQILAEMDNLGGIPAAAFGSYGWSGEAPDDISELLTENGGSLVNDRPTKAKDYPSDSELEQCRELGMKLAENCTA